MKRAIQGLLLAGTLVFGGAALAQGSTTQDPNAKVGAGLVRGGMVEHQGFMVPADERAFLERLHHINQLEIQLGGLARKNGQSQDVKNYGDMLIKDHTALDQRLMTYAQSKGHKLSEPRPLNDAERKAMAAEKAATDKLQSLMGMPFDSCFLASMVGDHDMALGKVMAAQRGFTSGDVVALLQQASQALITHRQQAYSLLGRIGPAVGMGVGGAGSTEGEMGDDSHMNTGMGGTGDLDKGQQGNTGKKGSMDPGNTKKY